MARAAGELAPEDKAPRAKPENLSGSAFDVAYIRSQIVMNQEAPQVLEREIHSGQNYRSNNSRSRSLPTVMEHLHRAQFLASELTGQTRSRSRPAFRARNDRLAPSSYAAMRMALLFGERVASSTTMK